MATIDEYKKEIIIRLRSLLVYPETSDEKEWHKAEQINQKILNAINEILKI